MAPASIEKVKNQLKRFLQQQSVKEALRMVKNYHRRYQTWLFQTKLVKVEREKYIRYRLKGACTSEEIEKAVETSPHAAIGETRTNKLIKRCIWRHSLMTAGLSALAAIANNTYIQLVLIAFDVVQFQLMTYIVVQKLLYLHGYHDLYDNNGKLISKASVMMSAISLLMIGRHKVGNLMKKLAKSVAKKAVRTYTKVGGRVVLINLLRQSFKWLGIEATKDTVALTATVTISALCAVLAGLISFWLFFPMCNRLNRNMNNYDITTINDKIKEGAEANEEEDE